MADANHRGACLFALFVTAFVMPLALFVAYAPTGQDAAGGFRQAELSPSDIASWMGGAAALFALAFAIGCTAWPKRPASRK